MTGASKLSRDGQTLTVRIPIKLARRGGRKLVLAPEGSEWAPRRAKIDSTLIKALARAHRWKRLLDSGKFASITELAEAENINQSYACRMLRLTLLAPDIVDAVLDGRQGAKPMLGDLVRNLPVLWDSQRTLFALC
jgi:hypothetical protein